MGRLTTDLAAALANADNLPPTEQLPDISLWDAFLPQHCVKRTPFANEDKVRHSLFHPTSHPTITA